MDSDDDDRFDHLPYAHVDGAEDTYVDMPNLQELQLLLGSLEEEILSQDPRFPERVYYFFHHTSLPVLERLFIRVSKALSLSFPKPQTWRVLS